ncbi:MAG: inositol monophosphatase, partial [Proteobacteria bacterium]
MGNLQHVSEKFQAGLVSEADKESERVISEHLRKNFPSIEFLGEESSYEGAKVQSGVSQPAWSPAGSAGRWILDPLDGTTNYV